MARRLHFNLFLHDTGHHEASWRLPESDPRSNLSLEAHQHLARVAEDAKFDSVFLADSPVVWSDPGRRPSGPPPPGGRSMPGWSSGMSLIGSPRLPSLARLLGPVVITHRPGHSPGRRPGPAAASR